MLSSVAEKLYWMTRYLERAEDTARLINAVTLMMLDMPRESAFGWSSLLKVAGLDELFYRYHSSADETSVMHFLMQDERNPSSMMACITHARENTRTFREVLPWESWEWVNEMYLYARKELAPVKDRRARYDVLQGIIRRRQSIVGLLAGTMSRDEVFQFLRLGRNIERADMTTRILDVSHAVTFSADTPAGLQYNSMLWMNILKALSAYQMYRRHVSVHAHGIEVVNFLLKDTAFPRAVAHCLGEITEVLDALPAAPQVLSAVRSLRSTIDTAPPDKFTGQVLHSFIDDVQIGLIGIDQQIRKRYFRNHDTPAQEEAATATQ